MTSESVTSLLRGAGGKSRIDRFAMRRGRPFRGRLGLSRALWGAAALAVALHAAHTVLGFGGDESTPFFATWLAFAAFLFSAGACLARAARVREQRATWLAIGVGLLVYSLGLPYYNLVFADAPPTGFPSLPDVFWLALTPAGATALILLVRAEARPVRFDLWLDGLIGGLAVASIGVTVLVEVVLSGPLAAPAANLTFALCDLLVVGFAVATWGLFGWRPSRGPLLLTLGFAALAVEDSVYLHQLVQGTLTPGTFLDSCWLAVMLVIAGGAIVSPRSPRGTRASGTQLVAVPFAFALSAVALAAYLHLVHETSALTTGLNTATLGAVVARFAVTARSHLRMLAELRQSEQRLGMVLDRMSDGLVAADADGNHLIFNRAAQRILGKGPENAGARTWQSRYGVFLDDGVTPAREDALPLVRAIEGETPAPMELVIRNEHHPEGRCIEISAAPLSDNGRPAGGVATFRDITERNRHKAELARREGAERANQAKSEFLSRMSHELRTPLNAIIGFGQLLEMDEPDPRKRESVEHILKGGRHLLDLIDEVLDISRIEAGNMTISLEPVNLDEATSEVLDLVKPLAAERGIRLERPFDEGPDRYVEADRQRLKQVLLNLLSNAIKYNQEGGLVAISVEPLAAARLRLLVTDTGTGMTKEQIEKVFLPFERLGAETGSVEGTGLGLALTKHMVELMGGTLAVESEPGVGSTFAVELPRAQGPLEGHLSDPVPESVPAPGAARVARVILHVEDNLSNYALVKQILSDRPEIRLLPAMQGNLGLELAQRHRPDLILLDLHLPGLPGEKVLTRLKDDPDTHGIPVVILSADATPGQVKRLLDAGAHAYLRKPLDVKEFVRVVDQALARSAVVA